MHIRMSNGKKFIEWTILGQEPGNVFAKQVITGEPAYRLRFDNTHLAGLWILNEVQFFMNEMDFKFVPLP